MAYIYGTPVTDKYYYGQKELLDELVQFNPTETYFLNGIRRIGKSSVLKEVERRANEKGYLSIYLDLLGKATSKEQGEDLGRIIENRLDTAQMPFNDLNWSGLELNECLSKWANFCRKNGKKSFILIDEAEKLHELSPEDIAEFQQVIVSSRDVVQVILTGTFRFFKTGEHREDLLEFQNCLTYKYIGMLSQDEATDLATQKQSEHPIEIPDHELKKLFYACGGHPFLIQYCCGQQYLPKEHQLSPFPERILSNQQLNNIFHNDYSLLPNNLQILLQKVLNGLKSEEPIDADGFQKLTHLGLLQKKEDGNYTFSYQLFRDWLMEHLANQPSLQSLTYKIS